LSEDKIAAVGVRVQQGVTMHGFAQNCDNTRAGYGGNIPCAITDAGVTTISEVIGADVSPADMVRAVSDAFAAEYATEGALA
jgi:lipoyl(octanoyl) transferase